MAADSGQDERGTELRGAGPQIQRGLDAPPVHDAARGNHGQARLSDKQAHQDGHAQAFIVAGRLENASVPARLRALRHDRIDASLLDERCLRQAGGGGQGADAGLPKRLHPSGGRHPEMKAEDRGAFLQQKFESLLVIEERLVDLRERRGHRRARLGKQCTEVPEPRLFAPGVATCSGMAKHIDVEWTGGQRSRFTDRLACLLDRARADPQRSKAAGIRHGRGKARRGNTRHGRLDDGEFDSDASQKT